MMRDEFPRLIDSPLISPHYFGNHATTSDKTLETVIPLMYRGLLFLLCWENYDHDMLILYGEL